MKCYKGTILSVDSNDGIYRYLVEDNGIIRFVGNELPDQFKNAELVELGSQVVAPAFVDTHQHFASLSTFNAGLNVMEAESYLEELLGSGRASRLNPIKTFADNGIVVSFGSDAPCTDPDPIQWIHRAVNHSNHDERITVQQALRMATYNGAYTTFDEKERGSLETGKVADMVILSDNPYTIESNKIADIKVEQLILSGKPYESAVTPLGKCICNGLLSNNRY